MDSTTTDRPRPRSSENAPALDETTLEMVAFHWDLDEQTIRFEALQRRTGPGRAVAASDRTPFNAVVRGVSRVDVRGISRQMPGRLEQGLEGGEEKLGFTWSGGHVLALGREVVRGPGASP